MHVVTSLSNNEISSVEFSVDGFLNGMRDIKNNLLIQGELSDSIKSLEHRVGSFVDFFRAGIQKSDILKFLDSVEMFFNITSRGHDRGVIIHLRYMDNEGCKMEVLI